MNIKLNISYYQSELGSAVDDMYNPPTPNIDVLKKNKNKNKKLLINIIVFFRPKILISHLFNQ